MYALLIAAHAVLTCSLSLLFLFLSLTLPGLVNAIIITLLIDQTPKLLGFKFECDCISYFSKSIQIIAKLNETAIAVVIVSSVAFGVMIFIRLLKKRYEDQSSIIKYTPAPLVVLTLGVSFSFALDLQGAFGVPVLGSASSGYAALISEFAVLHF
jgi:hypothetical protein